MGWRSGGIPWGAAWSRRRRRGRPPSSARPSPGLGCAACGAWARETRRPLKKLSICFFCLLKCLSNFTVVLCRPLEEPVVHRHHPSHWRPPLPAAAAAAAAAAGREGRGRGVGRGGVPQPREGGPVLYLPERGEVRGGGGRRGGEEGGQEEERAQGFHVGRGLLRCSSP